MNVPQLNPAERPRTYSLVQLLFEHEHGEHLSIEGIRQIERRAIAKLRAALTGELIEPTKRGPKISGAQREQIAAACDEGESRVDVAKRFGITKQYVGRICREAVTACTH